MHLIENQGRNRAYGPRRRVVNAAASAIAFIGLMCFGEAQAAPQRLMVLGDSLTAGYGLKAEDGFTRQLERALGNAGREVTVLNAGVSGDTTAGGLSRLGWALADKPDALIVELGANDGLRGLDPAATEKNLDAILQKAKGRGLPVLLTGMLAPPNLGQEYAAEFNAVYPRLAERHGVALYPFFLEGVAAEPDLNQDDGIHPNAQGVAEIVRRILPHVIRLLDRAGGAQKSSRPSSGPGWGVAA